MTAGKIPTDEETILSVEFLTVAQVAKWARVSTKSVYRWIEANKIPAIVRARKAGLGLKD